METLSSAFTSAVPYLLGAEAVVVLVGAAYAGVRFFRQRFGKSRDRLALLNHLLAPPRSSRYKSVEQLDFHLRWFKRLGLFIIPPILVATVVLAVEAPDLRPPSGFINVFFRVTQIPFAIGVFEMVYLWPFFKFLSRERDRFEAEGRVL